MFVFVFHQISIFEFFHLCFSEWEANAASTIKCTGQVFHFLGDKREKANRWRCRKSVFLLLNKRRTERKQACSSATILCFAGVQANIGPVLSVFILNRAISVLNISVEPERQEKGESKEMEFQAAGFSVAAFARADFTLLSHSSHHCFPLF